MAGIIPLVYLTNINVRSSGQISLFPFFSSPLSLLYTLQFDIGKRLFCPSEPYSANTSICLFYEKKSVAKAKVFFLLIQVDNFSPPAPPLYPCHISSLIQHLKLFERIRGFRSQWLQLPISRIWRKSWTLSSWGKNPFFLEIARCSTRARLPKGSKTFRNFFIFSIHVLFTFPFRNLPNPKLLVHRAEFSICK